MGTDRRLVPADALDQYFEVVAGASDRVELVDIGPTTDGRRTLAAIVSAPANIANIETIKANNQRLADPRTLDPDEARELARTQKVVLAIGAGMHGSEMAPTQASSDILYWLATATDADTVAALDNIVVVLIPSLNPDGYRLAVQWYGQTLGTAFEGQPMPALDHRYAGHDINRDAFMMNLAENRNLAAFFYGEWHPQVFLTMHEMGKDGARFFVPPNVDPIDPNYDPLIWRTAGLLGSAMALELQREGRKGVLSNAVFDYYWPGYEDSAPLGHNVVCLLTEVAGVDMATPVTVDPGALTGGERGLRSYGPQINFPDPWPGGRWTLNDAVQYQVTAVRGLVQAVSVYRRQIVENFYDMGRRAIAAGLEGDPFAFIIPPDQHDAHAVARLEDLLGRAGVEMYAAIDPFSADGKGYPDGSVIILMSQPYRAYVKTLLEAQRYPASSDRRDGSPDPPYDVTGWTLPYQMGIEVVTIERSFEPPLMSRITSPTVRPGTIWGERRPGHYVIEANGTAGALAVGRLVNANVPVSWTLTPIDAGGYTYAAGSLVVAQSREADEAVAKIVADLGVRADGVRGRPQSSTQPIGHARVGLYRPWVVSTDEGWTRFLLDEYGVPYSFLTDANVRAGNLREAHDVIVLPSLPANLLVNGHTGDELPAEFVGGLGTAGVEALRAFVEAGGTLVCLDRSGQLAIDAARDGGGIFRAPGSILRLEVDTSQPLGFGMQAETSAFFADSAAYSSTGSAGSGTIRTIAHYPSTDLLRSGWIEGEGVIAGRAAVVEASVGTGRVVLLGFRTQHRAQSLATFRLLFNAIFSSPQAPDPRRR